MMMMMMMKTIPSSPSLHPTTIQIQNNPMKDPAAASAAVAFLRQKQKSIITASSDAVELGIPKSSIQALKQQQQPPPPPETSHITSFLQQLISKPRLRNLLTDSTLLMVHLARHLAIDQG
jgi:hypothetical protein